MQAMYCTSRLVSSGCCKVLCKKIACSDYVLEGEDCREDGGQDQLGLFIWQEILTESKLINTRPTTNFSVSTSRLFFSCFRFEQHSPIYIICPTVLKRVLGWKHMSLNQEGEMTVSLIKIAWKPQTWTQKLYQVSHANAGDAGPFLAIGFPLGSEVLQLWIPSSTLLDLTRSSQSPVGLSNDSSRRAYSSFPSLKPWPFELNTRYPSS